MGTEIRNIRSISPIVFPPGVSMLKCLPSYVVVSCLTSTRPSGSTYSLMANQGLLSHQQELFLIFSVK